MMQRIITKTAATPSILAVDNLTLRSLSKRAGAKSQCGCCCVWSKHLLACKTMSTAPAGLFYHDRYLPEVSIRGAGSPHRPDQASMT